MSESVAGTKHWAKYNSGFPDDLSEEQSKIMEAFLGAVAPESVEACKFEHETRENFACRLLRARKFDQGEASKMLEASVKWRHDENIPALAASSESDVLRTCIGDEVQAYYGHTWIPNTYDKAGRPVWIEKTGRIDIAAMQLLTTEECILRWHIRSICKVQAEATAEASRVAGKVVTDCCTIMDLDGFSRDMFSSTTRSYLKRVAAVDSNHFPETMGRMFVINTPGFFSFVWAVAKGFVDERTRSKIEILGGQSAYLPRLLEYIPKERIPVEYGGELVVPGGLFPPSRTQKTIVASGKSFAPSVDLTAGQTVRVRWIAKPDDIKYSLSFKAVGEEVEEFVVPLKDFKKSASNLQENVYTAKSDGKLTMTFDNSGGWRQREVHHRYDFVGADGKVAGNGSLEALEAAAKAATDGAGGAAGAAADAGPTAGAGAAAAST